jgi:hypothetical protein
MLAVLFVSTASAWKDRRQFFAIVTLVAGLVSAYLMNRERIRAEDTLELVSARLTGWFWLGLAENWPGGSQCTSFSETSPTNS